MRILVLLIALFSLPVTAADYSPWLDGEGPAVCQAQSAPKGYPGRYCCVHCRANEAPCNGKCVTASSSGKKAFCKGDPGCACPGKP
jgi:hypothetical protein